MKIKDAGILPVHFSSKTSSNPDIFRIHVSALQYFVLPLLLFLFLLTLPISGLAQETPGTPGLSIQEAADARPRIIVGDDIYYPPFTFLDKEGQPTGYNADLMRAIARAIGYDVEFRLDEWSRVRQALEAGEIDVISGMVYSREREEIYSFSIKHMVNAGEVFVRAGRTVSRLEDLRGKTVVVQRGDVVAELLARQSQALEIRLVEVNSAREAMELLEHGEYDYAAMMKLPGLYAIKDNGFRNVRPQNLPLLLDDYGMAVLKGNEDLLMKLNSGLQMIKVSGEYQEIYDRWIAVYEDRSLYDSLSKYRWILVVLAILLVAPLASNYVLRRLVEQKTQELREANELLQANAEEIEANLEELVAIEEELRAQNSHLITSQEQLRESEERNRAILEALPDLIFTIHQDGTILDCSVGDSTMLYAPPEVFLGKRVPDILPPEVAAKSMAAIQKVLAHGTLQRFEYTLEIEGTVEIYEMRMSRFRKDDVIAIARQITNEKRYQEKIEYLSHHDKLTGLLNRHAFEEMLLQIDKPENLPVMMVMSDVNGLKLVNDSFGHATGDALLVKVAQVLRQAVEEHQSPAAPITIYRIGGDEFALLSPNSDARKVEALIARIQELAAVEEIHSIALSISFGWAAKIRPEENIQEVFNTAENFMYKRKLFEGPSMRGKTIQAIINTLHEKNKREEEHSRRVSELASLFAKALGMTDQEIKEIENMGLLHDIGKVAVNESILNKEGRLTPEEYEEIKLHPEIGYRILSSVNDMAEMAEYVLYHHEKWDGTGYPRGIRGEEIPLQARIIAIVDAYDAMISHRSYRASRTEEEAVAELRKFAGTQFDPILVEIFIKYVVRGM